MQEKLLQSISALAVALKALTKSIKMAQVVITLKIMPEAPDTDLGMIEEEASKLVSEFGGKVARAEHEPVAFGIKAVKLIFSMDEDIGSTEELENSISSLEGVMSAEVVDVRRTLG